MLPFKDGFENIQAVCFTIQLFFSLEKESVIDHLESVIFAKISQFF